MDLVSYSKTIIGIKLFTKKINDKSEFKNLFETLFSTTTR